MRRFLVCAVVLAALVATAFVAGGYVLFSRSQADPLTEADAIVVLGGDTDGRIDYGLRLAREGYAHTVVISDSYPAEDVTVYAAFAKAMALGCRMPPQSQASSALTAEVTASSSSLARARAAAN
ncbi:YdcF family protein [Mycolicibacterium mengxianglii]|uniref:YdcF family protein n=1 Tax=Mycolicibacterium mengxianglii TaxID=2736649 RepID=UPI0018D07479|nr:hypothetical protein [Mycolicibacterium mengxianglii]